ncbi:MAG: subtilisin family serine protease, partial [Planctomycetaceae bacterium]
MLLSNWLRPLRSRVIRRRESWRAHRAPAAMRTQQVVEQLETRLYLSGLTSYSIASSDWFGNVNSSFTSPSGLSGSSSSSDVSGDGATIRQFLVRLTPEATARAGSLAGVQELITDSSVELVVTDGLGLPGQVIVSTTERDSVQVVRSLDANPAVAYFEEDFSVGATARFPNEDAGSTEFSRQFGLDNTGQNGGTLNADIDAPEAWDITIGSVETVVSVIDSGVDFTHPDLYLNIWINQGEIPQSVRDILDDIDTDPDGAGTEFAKDGLITFRDLNTVENRARLVDGQPLVRDLNGNNYIDAGDLLDDPFWADGIDTDKNEFEDDLVGWDFFENDNKPFDEHRHGTHVAGILGAIGDNANPDEDFDGGVVGVNWQTSMMPLRFLNENNSGDISDAVEAINYTTMMRNRDTDPVNVRVSNNSWGSSGSFSQTLFDAVAGNLEADILFVTAAGNGNVLGQGIDNDDLPFFPANLELANVISVAAVNNRGELASFSNFGTTTVDIAAPGVDIISTEPGGGFISRSGTSMATPYVSGVAALVFDQFPNATAQEVRDAILSGATGTNSSLDGFVAGQRSLNAFGALTASTFAPVPELVPINTIAAAGTTEVVITVSYTDDGVVNTDTFDVRDVEVTRPGFSQTLLTPIVATTTTISVDGQDRDAAVYRFTAPGGTWDATENGTWL